METMENPGPGSYAWDNSWADAGRRLELLEQCWDPRSHEALRSAGVRPGWRCLEVGGGAGSIARWLCDAVGPDGTVVAVDLDTRFLARIDVPNLEVIEADIVTEGLPAGPFDLIHTRAVLATSSSPSSSPGSARGAPSSSRSVTSTPSRSPSRRSTVTSGGSSPRSSIGPPGCIRTGAAACPPGCRAWA